ncbi:MAG: hypothetical protein AB8G23_23125 [Myxococcota bacterium]
MLRTSKARITCIARIARLAKLSGRPAKRAVLGSLGLLLLISNGGCVVAALPQADAVKSGDALPIDGTYLLESNQKRYRFERGRAWILDALVVGLIRQDPGQVVLQDIVQTGPLTYTGTDIGIGGVPWRAEVSEAGLSSVSSTLPFPFLGAFVPIELDDPDWSRRQINAPTILPAPRSSAPTSTSTSTSPPPPPPTTITPPITPPAAQLDRDPR